MILIWAILFLVYSFSYLIKYFSAVYIFKKQSILL